MKLKKYHILIILFMNFTLWGQAQNFSVRFISENTLRAIKFIDKDIGIAVGDSGTILLTKDLGNSWKDLKPITKFTLRSICFINATTGFIVGGDYNQTKNQYEGIILKSTDKGDNWLIDKSVEYEYYNTIFFINELTGFIGGTGRTPPFNYIPAFNKTTDGGKTWYQVKYPSDRFIGPLFNIKFVNEKIGYAVGSSISYKTTDSGENWFDQTAGSQYYWPSSYDQYFFDENNGMQFGDAILKTTNGGNKWEYKTMQPPLGIRSVKYINNQEAIAVGFYGFLSKTTDGGPNWVNYSMRLENALLGVDIPRRTNGFAVGEAGVLVSFNFDSLTTKTNLSTLAFLNPRSDQIVYNNYQCLINWKSFNLPLSQLKLEYSLDDGKTWKYIMALSWYPGDNYTYTWNTSNIDTSSQARIKLSDPSSGIYFISDRFKIIKESRSILLTYPKGGELFRANSDLPAAWDYDYQSNSKVGFQFIPGYYPELQEFPISQKSGVLQTPYGQDEYRLKIFDIDYPQIYSISAPFRVKLNPQFWFYNPVLGEVWQVDSIKTIKFDATNIEKVKLEYSTNSGTNWFTIENSLQSDSNIIKTCTYNWKVPNTPSKYCVIRLSSNDNPNINLVSKRFEITDNGNIGLFPLAIGNKWFYKYLYGSGISETDRVAGIQKIWEITDTVKLSDNFTYHLIKINRRINQNSFTFSTYDTLYIRQQNNLIIIKSNILRDNFNPRMNYTVNLFNFTRIDFSSVLNDSLRYYLIGDDYNAHSIADSLGFTYFNWTRSMYGYSKLDVLAGCVLNGNKYGETLDSYIVGIEDEQQAVPFNFSLSQNYPNPFNPETTISYSIPKSENVSLKIYDLLGREIALLVDEYKSAGTYHSTFNTLHSSLSSGVYFYRLQAGSFNETKKFVLIK